ncbi:hypothetical protein M0R45_030389 [Rubus argutus]|uniref:Uncharacterized protein n=1 Tax=Rubus argutus TaxID=59490 RepID=A0AAW1WDG4_RUBAR
MSTTVQLKARLGELIQAAELGLMVAVQRAGFFTVAWLVCSNDGAAVIVIHGDDGDDWNGGIEIAEDTGSVIMGDD